MHPIQRMLRRRFLIIRRDSLHEAYLGTYAIGVLIVASPHISRLTCGALHYTTNGYRQLLPPALPCFVNKSVHHAYLDMRCLSFARKSRTSALYSTCIDRPSGLGILSTILTLFPFWCTTPNNVHDMAQPHCKVDDFGPAQSTHCQDKFDFTLLFEQSILSIGPSVLLLLVYPLRLLLLRSKSRSVVRPGVLAWTKLVRHLLLSMGCALILSGHHHCTRLLRVLLIGAQCSLCVTSYFGFHCRWGITYLGLFCLSQPVVLRTRSIFQALEYPKLVFVIIVGL
jgi:hypothetical protein